MTAAGNKNYAVKIVDRCCLYASILILLILVLLAVLSLSPAGKYLPAWLASGGRLRGFLLPVLSSAAVGYLTNAIAIWMLFRPYEKHWFFPQGVIPRQKKSFGRELGILIPRHLLQPEKISAQIGRVALQYLKDPQFVQRIRDYVKNFLAEHSGKLAQVVVPYVQQAAVQAVRDTMTRDNFLKLCRLVTENYLTTPSGREKTVKTVVELFKNLLPELSSDLKKVVAERVATAFRREHPFLNWFKETFSDNSVSDEVEKFWRQGEAELLASLEERETREKIARYLAKILLLGREWLERPEHAGRLEAFLAESRGSVEEYVRAYLAEKLPVLADELLGGDAFWQWLREKALPAVQLYVVRQLRGDGGTLLARVNLPGKIEEAVDRMDMKQLHNFVIQASNDNLTLLQILGFFLGAVAGVIMAVVNLT